MKKNKLWMFREYHREITGADNSLKWADALRALKHSEYDRSIQQCSWISPNDVTRIIFRRFVDGRDVRYPGNWNGEKFRLLLESIRLNGIMQPATAYVSFKEDGYVIVRGCHRTVCGIYLQIGIPVHILELQS